jgi:dTMP kinase
MDEQAADFHQRVREAYLYMAAREPERFRVIDGRGAVESIAAAVWDAIRPL